jgi:hypothetical protein
MSYNSAGAHHNQDELRLVSLGCYCGPKLSFRKLGFDVETLPFDWIRTRIDGILDFLQNDFDKFFHYDTKEQTSQGTGKQMMMYRSYYHSFWHDDLSDPADIEKYKRRIQRFQAIDAHTKPVLFVRAIGNDEEIQHLGTLCDVLMKKFGRFAKLLAIVDFQPTDEPLVISGCDNLLVYKLNRSVHSGHLGEAPYVKPITEAIKWAKTGRAEGARVTQSLSTEKFDANNLAWIVPSVFEPFETVPRGGMKPLAPCANRAMNGLPGWGVPSLAAGGSITLPIGASAGQKEMPLNLGRSVTLPIGASAGQKMMPLNLGRSVTLPVGASAGQKKMPLNLGRSVNLPVGASAGRKKMPLTAGMSFSAVPTGPSAGRTNMLSSRPNLSPRPYY